MVALVLPSPTADKVNYYLFYLQLQTTRINKVDLKNQGKIGCFAVPLLLIIGGS